MAPWPARTPHDAAYANPAPARHEAESQPEASSHANKQPASHDMHQISSTPPCNRNRLRTTRFPTKVPSVHSSNRLPAGRHGDPPPEAARLRRQRLTEARSALPRPSRRTRRRSVCGRGAKGSPQLDLLQRACPRTASISRAAHPHRPTRSTQTACDHRWH